MRWLLLLCGVDFCLGQLYALLHTGGQKIHGGFQESSVSSFCGDGCAGGLGLGLEIEGGWTGDWIFWLSAWRTAIWVEAMVIWKEMWVVRMGRKCLRRKKTVGLIVLEGEAVSEETAA